MNNTITFAINLDLVRMYLEEWCLSKQSVICDNTLTTLGQPWLLIRLTVDRVRHTTTLLPKLELSSEICGTDVNCSNYFINVPDDSRLSKSSWLLHVRVLSRHGTCAISPCWTTPHLYSTNSVLYEMFNIGKHFIRVNFLRIRKSVLLKIFIFSYSTTVTHNSLVIFWVSPSLPLYADIPDSGF